MGVLFLMCARSWFQNLGAVTINDLYQQDVRLALGSMSSLCKRKVRFGWFLWMSYCMYGGTDFESAL